MSTRAFINKEIKKKLSKKILIVDGFIGIYYDSYQILTESAIVMFQNIFQTRGHGKPFLIKQILIVVLDLLISFPFLECNILLNKK